MFTDVTDMIVIVHEAMLIWSTQLFSKDADNDNA